LIKHVRDLVGQRRGPSCRLRQAESDNVVVEHLCLVGMQDAGQPCICRSDNSASPRVSPLNPKLRSLNCHLDRKAVLLLFQRGDHKTQPTDATARRQSVRRLCHTSAQAVSTQSILATCSWSQGGFDTLTITWRLSLNPPPWTASSPVSYLLWTALHQPCARLIARISSMSIRRKAASGHPPGARPKWKPLNLSGI